MLTCSVQSGVVQFCGLVSAFIVRKMGDLALHSALDARLETKKKNLPDAGKGPAICMHNLHCGTRYLITVLALWLFRCPVRRGAFGGQVRFLGDFGVLVYPPQALPGRAIALRLC